MKYYYTDPLPALYMHREFNVRFVSYMNESISELELISEIINPQELTTIAPYIVSPGSTKIFDIMFWDLAMIQSCRNNEKKHYGIINNITSQSIMIGKAMIPLENIVRKEIIKRKDKLFFMPKQQ